jgi:hypothetical protein
VYYLESNKRMLSYRNVRRRAEERVCAREAREKRQEDMRAQSRERKLREQRIAAGVIFVRQSALTEFTKRRRGLRSRSFLIKSTICYDQLPSSVGTAIVLVPSFCVLPGGPRCRTAKWAKVPSFVQPTRSNSVIRLIGCLARRGAPNRLTYLLPYLLTYFLPDSPKQGRQCLAGLCCHRSQAGAPVP